jgi:hypothetical protein
MSDPSDIPPGTIISSGLGGIAATHPVREPLPILASPATAKQFNTVRSGIFPIACWRADDINFAFDSSFIGSAIASETRRLKRLMDIHPGSRISIFGHADPVGNEEYNKGLSGRRAQAVYGMLTRRDDLWEDLYGHGDWGVASVQSMLAALKFKPGRSDGTMDQPTKDAIKAFQAQNGLGQDGVAGPATRKVLYLQYMDLICRGPDSNPFKLTPDQFLGLGADSGGKGDYQGCSEFNPLLLFSQAEQQQFALDEDKTRRNQENQPNRRVVVLLFRAGAKVTADLWPCPRAKEPTAGCRKRFWSDHDKRLTNGPERREFGQDKEMFACRFYDRMINSNSPCERILAVFKIRLFDRHARPIPGAPFQVIGQEETPQGDPNPDTADENGDITLRDVKVPSTVTVRWSRVKRDKDDPIGPPPAPPEFEFEKDVFVNIPPEPPAPTTGAGASSKGDDAKNAAASQRLSNLGFAIGETLEDQVRFFQRELGVEETGKLADIDDELRRRHADCDPPSRYEGHLK